MKNNDQKQRMMVVVAMAAIYLIWGTTYAAIRVVVTALPPLLAGGARFTLAGALLTGVLCLSGTPLPSRRQLLGPLLTAVLMILGSHGLVATAEVSVPSGQAAVVMSTMPMWMALFQWLAPGGRRPPVVVVLGIALGFCGVWLLCRPSGAVQAVALLSLACAPPMWALGSFLTPRLPQPPASMMTTGLQMLLGGGMLLVAGLARGELATLTRLDLAATGTAPWVGLAYLTVFGSLVTLCAYTWLLRELGPGPVSTYSFVNPLVAVVFGNLALGEQPSPDMLSGGGLVVGAVALVLSGRLGVRLRLPRRHSPTAS
jgi:drug/metabolite transporter (DMT)-like permease